MLSRFKAGIAIAFSAVAFVAIGVSAASAAPIVTVTPASHDFGDQIVNVESSNFNFTVSNTGDANYTLQSATLTGSNAGQFKIKPATTCAPNQVIGTSDTCGVRVSFAPTNTGNKTANLVLATDQPGSPTLIPLTGKGVADPTPVLHVSSPIITFGDQLIGAGPTAIPQSIVLTNTGGGTIDIGTNGLAGPNQSDFAISSQNCSQAHLAAGAACSMQVTFNPMAAGVRSAQIPITSSLATQNVNLSGMGIAPALTGTASIALDRNLPRPNSSRALVKLPVVCTVVDMPLCHGKVKVTAKGSALGFRKKAARKTYSVAESNFKKYSYPADGPHSVIAVSLTPKALKALNRRGKLPVQVKFTVEQEDGSSVIQKPLNRTILKARTHKKHAK